MRIIDAGATRRRESSERDARGGEGRPARDRPVEEAYLHGGWQRGGLCDAEARGRGSDEGARQSDKESATGCAHGGIIARDWLSGSVTGQTAPLEGQVQVQVQVQAQD